MTETALYIIEVNRDSTTGDIKYYYAIKLSEHDANKLQELDKKITDAQKAKDASMLENFQREKERLISDKQKRLVPLSAGKYKVGDIIKKELVPDSIAPFLEHKAEI